MRVRYYFLLTMLVTFIAVTITFFFLGRKFFLASVAEKDSELAKGLAVLLHKATQDELDCLDQIARYLGLIALLDENVDTPFSATADNQAAFETMEAFKIGLLVTLDESGRPVTAKRYDFHQARIYSVIPYMVELSQPGGLLDLSLNHSVQTNGLSGLLPFENRLYLVALRPLPLPHWQRGLHKFVMVGRDLNDGDLRSKFAAALPGRLTGEFQVDAFRENTGQPFLNNGANVLQETLGYDAVVTLPDGITQRASITLRDLHDRPAAKLSFIVESPLPNILKARFKHLASLLGILLFGALLILVIFTEFNIIFPLERIIKQIGIVRRNSSPESTQEYLGADGDVNNAIQELTGILNLLEANRAAVVESEKYARTLIEAMPDAFLVVNNNGIILIAKSESEDEFGSCAEILIGRDLSALNLENSETKRLSERLVRVLNTGRLHVLEFRRKREDGSCFWGEARISKLDSNRALVFVRDVTALRQGEEERDRFDDQILQVQKFESLGVLASGIAHDFNNILAAIVGYTEIVKQGLPQSQPLQQELDYIVRAAMRASTLTGQLMNYAGQGARDFKPVNLNAMLSEMLQLLRASLSKKARFDVSLAHDLPDVQGDTTQLWQVAMNLLTNASDALDGRSGSIQLTTRRYEPTAAELTKFLGTAGLQPGVYAMLEVADTGYGMNEATIARIFDPFFTTRASGRGLGLSAVLGILTAHGGGIRVQSEVGKGTVFQVIIPAVTSQPGTAPVIPPPVSLDLDSHAIKDFEPPVMFAGSGIDDKLNHALIADDEPHIAKLLGLLIREAGWKVTTVSNGHDAVEAVKNCNGGFSAMFLDDNMPEMDGFQTLQKIQQTWPRIPAIIVSGNSRSAQRYKELRPFEVLTKPFKRDDLAAVLKKLTLLKTRQQGGCS